MTGWMIDNNDPARLEIVERAKKLGITGSPDKSAHALGTITLADGTVVNAHVLHAVDPIITDGNELVMINRSHEPGKGKPALPGGMIDPAKGGGVESAIQAAAREAAEEAGIDLAKAKATLIGTRNMDRPFDVRVAMDNSLEEKYGIKQGDMFMVSTQAVRFDVPDLAHTKLTAGDDALPGTARRVRIDSLMKPGVGIPDHFDMIAATFPDLFIAKTLKIITTDFGADCDDQKAVSGLIESLRSYETLAFIVSGPHPQLAAQAIGEKYHAKTGRYPLLALGEQFEGDKKSDGEIYSLTDGQPMLHKNTTVPVLSQVAFQEAVDTEIKSGKLQKIEQIVLAPLHGVLEYYNLYRALLTDDVFHANLAKIEKTATLQFQRTDDGQCKGNNYQKSSPGIADGFLAQLQEQGFETVFFDGTVAKMPEFLMRVTQDKQPGLQKAAESYMATMQVPWLYMTEAIGVTPSAQDMHAGMFTAGASFPFGVHVSAGTPAGFGAERALKEICGITRNNPDKFAAAFQPIAAELERFDGAVLKSLQEKHPAITSVDQMREDMHHGMMAALQSFAGKKGIVSAGEKMDSFTDLFRLAREKNIKISPYGYMQEFTQELYAQSPVTRDITAIAAMESGRSFNGQSHTQILSSALAAHGAQAIVYDAVAVGAADMVRGNDALKTYFGEKTTSGTPIINITAAKVDKLKQSNTQLYAVFSDGVRQALTVDGSVLAQEGAQTQRKLNNAPLMRKISPQ